MKTCTRCGSQAINPHCHGRLPGIDLDLCDVCYWRKRAEGYPEMLEILTGLLDSIEAYSVNKPENKWDEYDYMMLPRWKAAQQLVERLK